jgi:hypothetical protein
LLVHLLHYRQQHGENDMARVRLWLSISELGGRLVQHLADEAELLDMVANRLNISGDEELREIGDEVGKVAERLRSIVGASA